MRNDIKTQLERVVKKFSLPESCSSYLLEYINILMRWNRKINLISRKHTDIVRSLVGPSLLYFKLKSELPDEFSVVDLGSGAGFPAMIIKLCDRDRKIVMIDTNSKKTAFLTYLCAYFSLEGCNVLKIDFCDYRKSETEDVLITVRGVRIDEKLLRCIKKTKGKWLLYFTSPRNHLPLKMIASSTYAGVEAKLYEL